MPPWRAKLVICGDAVRANRTRRWLHSWLELPSAEAELGSAITWVVGCSLGENFGVDVGARNHAEHTEFTTYGLQG